MDSKQSMIQTPLTAHHALKRKKVHNWEEITNITSFLEAISTIYPQKKLESLQKRN